MNARAARPPPSSLERGLHANPRRRSSFKIAFLHACPRSPCHRRTRPRRARRCDNEPLRHRLPRRSARGSDAAFRVVRPERCRFVVRDAGQARRCRWRRRARGGRVGTPGVGHRLLAASRLDADRRDDCSGPLRTDLAQAFFVKVATNAEPTSYAFSFPTATGAAGPFSRIQWSLGLDGRREHGPVLAQLRRHSRAFGHGAGRRWPFGRLPRAQRRRRGYVDAFRDDGTRHVFRWKRLDRDADRRGRGPRRRRFERQQGREVAEPAELQRRRPRPPPSRRRTEQPAAAASSAGTPASASSAGANSSSPAGAPASASSASSAPASTSGTPGTPGTPAPITSAGDHGLLDNELHELDMGAVPGRNDHHGHEPALELQPATVELRSPADQGGSPSGRLGGQHRGRGHGRTPAAPGAPGTDVNLIVDIRGNGPNAAGGPGHDAFKTRQNPRDLRITGSINCGWRGPTRTRTRFRSRAGRTSPS